MSDKTKTALDRLDAATSGVEKDYEVRFAPSPTAPAVDVGDLRSIAKTARAGLALAALIKQMGPWLAKKIETPAVNDMVNQANEMLDIALANNDAVKVINPTDGSVAFKGKLKSSDGQFAVIERADASVVTVPMFCVKEHVEPVEDSVIAEFYTEELARAFAEERRPKFPDAVVMPMPERASFIVRTRAGGSTLARNGKPTGVQLAMAKPFGAPEDDKEVAAAQAEVSHG